MSARLKKFFASNWPILILIFISLALTFLNYQPGTFLTGWDNLQFELNPLLNLKRSLNTTWQEYQGFGLLGGMGHSAGLLPSLLALIYTQLFSPQFFRYLTTLSLLTLGPLGTYLLAKRTLLKTHHFDKSTKNIAAFFAGLFYLLNLGTLQTFYIPFETFTWFYAALPWLLYLTLSYFHHPSRRNIILLIFGLLLATPAFYVQTMFVVFLLCLLPFLLTPLFKKQFLPLLIYLFALLGTQAFWLFPSLYFTFTSSKTTVNSLQNQISTPEIILRNQEYGPLKDVALLKGFSFDYADLAPSGRFEIMMGPWVDHLNNQTIQLIGYAFFALVLIGLFYSFRRRLSYTLPLAFIFSVSLFFLINLNPPTGPLFRFLQQNIPLLGQFFRSVFTKWSLPAALSFSLFFSVGVVFLLDIFSFLHFRLTTIITSFTLILLLLLFSSPMFQGHLIYPAMRQNIPGEYFALFDYMKSQDPNTRLMNLPQHTLWGWGFTDWGYRGSGFLWYGLEQPIMDRAFDVWTPYGDQYYQELGEAIYSQDLTRFHNLIEKYQINWILIDRSVIIPASDYQTGLYLPETIELLGRSPKVTHNQDFGFLSLYRTNLDTKPQTFFNTKSLSLLPEQRQNPRLNSEKFHLLNTPTDNRSTVSEQASNCDAFNSTQYNREFTEDQVLYTATNANSCDHFTFPELPHAYGYQLKIEHQNLVGTPFLVCLESYASRTCHYYNYLTKGSDWHKDTITLPPMNEQDYGYTLHLYNYSIGQNKTINAWRQIEINPLNPSNFNAKPISPPPSTIILNSQKRTYSLYTLEVNSAQIDSQLTLNQGFDPGWKAYFINDDIAKLPTSILYLYSSLLVPLPEAHHFETNGWANGWVLPQGKSTFLIVYQPQLLQYLGFTLLALLPLLMILPKTKR